jgi:hypothetical protein
MFAIVNPAFVGYIQHQNEILFVFSKFCILEVIFELVQLNTALPEL